MVIQKDFLAGKLTSPLVIEEVGGNYSNFWSSTENSNTPANAWNVNLNNGNTNNNAKTTATNYVRCVRRYFMFGLSAFIVFGPI